MTATLTISAHGEITLPQDVLDHLGVRAGDRLWLDLLPGKRVQLTAARPHSSWDRFQDSLKELNLNPYGVRLTIEELNEAIAETGAAAGLGEPLDPSAPEDWC
jgi:bifunctional DNA-binding transcriptional regulator/antitoxin component of YhaV-PrlF toxin-antitoxin module